MYEVTTEPARNLMMITYSGHVEPSELVQGRAKLLRALESMQPGFQLLTDLGGLESMEYTCAPEIEATMDLIRKHQVKSVLRVVPDPKKDIGFTVMSYFHYGRKIPVMTFDSREEALARLSA